jgi:hypothetical protein
MALGAAAPAGMEQTPANIPTIETAIKALFETRRFNDSNFMFPLV